MKSLIRIIITSYLLLHTSYLLNAQISINEDGSSPDASAMLDVKSTDKGILIPRMTTSERTNISSPATGLMVYDTDENTFWYYNGTAWSEVGSAGAFITENGLTRSATNDDDFVFGADSINHNSGNESKFFFNKDKFAFRAGLINNTNWDVDSLGFYSFGVGSSVKATGTHSIAIGASSEAIGSYSTALGGFNSATGNGSTVFGNSNEATGDYSTAFGFFTEATGNNSTAFGNSTEATGNNSTAFGFSTEAIGDYTTTLGIYNTAPSYGEVVLGMYNTTYTPNSTSSFDSNDRLFGIGNGTSTSDRSDAFVINKNGNVWLNGALTIDSSYTFPITDGINGQTLTTDGSGNLTWASSITGVTSILQDADGDTQIQVEESSDDDIIRFDLNGTEFMRLDSGKIEVLNTGYSVFLGEGAGENDDFSNNENVFIGYQSGNSNTTGLDNAYVGYRAGYENETGYSNVFLGMNAGYKNETGYSNVFLGRSAGFNNYGSDNVFLGMNSGYNNYGSDNVFLGRNAGFNSSGSDNIFLGRSAGYSESGSNKLYIENSTSSSPLIYGEFDNDLLQINGTLNINGNYNFPTTDGSTLQILTTDGSGTLSWSDNNAVFTSENGITYSNNNSDDFVFGADSLDYGNGSESKFFFDKSKGAFRAGVVDNTDWDESNIGDYSVAFGENNMAFGQGSFAVGADNDVNNYVSVAFGNKNQVTAAYSTAFGEENTISNSHSFAFGYNQTLNASFSVAFGADNTISNNYSFANGHNNTISNNYSFAFGHDNTISNNYSFAFGYNHTVDGNFASALGQSLEVPSYGEVAIGFYNTTYTANSATSSDTNDRLFVIGNGTSSSRSDAMVVYKNGNTEINGSVGIGTSPTNADLEVVSSGSHNSFSLSNIGYLNTGGAGTSTYNGRFAIYADGRISGTAFIAHSDERIKNIIGQSNGQSDLDILNKIEITDYTMKDKIKHDDKVIKKVIAQQVKEVYPQAVSTNTTQVIPNIYQKATIDENGWVVFNDELGMTNDELKVGEKVQILFEDKKELLEVLEIKGNTFKVKPITSYQSPITIFVYGRQVNDFHTVDYEAISMLNVSATQQLAKENEDLKVRMSDLEKENKALKAQLEKINKLEATLQQLQAQLENQ